MVADHQAYLDELMAQINRAAISQRLGESLKTAGLTQPEMADLLHVHVRSVEDYVSPRKSVVPFDRLEEWASHTRTTVEWLLHGDETAARIQLDPVRLEELLARLERLVELLEQERARAPAG